MDKINPIIVNHIEPVGHEERVAWIGSCDEDLPDQGIQVLSVPNTPTLPEKGWEEWEDCYIPGTGGPKELAVSNVQSQQPGGGDGRDAGEGGVLPYGGRGGDDQGDGQHDQAGRRGGVCTWPRGDVP